MSLEIVGFSAELRDQWDEFCAGSNSATLLHTRRFLGYHRERFRDASVLIRDGGKLVAVFPAAVAPADSSVVVSHPGATFGGLVHQGWFIGQRTIDTLQALRLHYAAQGFRTLSYKAVPHIYCVVPSQEDLYALFRLEAVRVRCELSCAIDLASRRAPSERRQRGLKKANKVVTVSDDMSHLAELWAVVEQNLQSRHGAHAVHTLEELVELQQLFPQDIRLCCALIDGRVEAGTILFNSRRVWHAQYIASSERGNAVSALDAVFERLIGDSRVAGARYFDFGTSNREAGRVLNEGLYRFKAEFGGGGVAHETYALSLTD